MMFWKRKPKIVSLERTCFACPAQWEGKLADGRFVYIRYRHGCGSISFGPTEEAAVLPGLDDNGGTTAFCWDTHDGNGFMTDHELLAVLRDAKIRIAKGIIITERCACDPDKLGAFGCEVCGKKPSPEARARSRAEWDRMWRGFTTS